VSRKVNIPKGRHIVTYSLNAELLIPLHICGYTV